MEDFAWKVEDQSMRSRLVKTSNRKKPFSQFSNALIDSADYHGKWFAFKTQRQMEWVEAQLKKLEE